MSDSGRQIGDCRHGNTKEHCAECNGMTDERRQALANIRKIEAGWQLCHVYPGTSADCYMLEKMDRSRIADLYLAEHPADEDEAITEEWLLSIGLAWDEFQYAFGIRMSNLTLWIRANGQIWMFGSGMIGGRVCLGDRLKTRGEIRRLCAVMGIELKEKV